METRPAGAEEFAERTRYALLLLRDCIEVNPGKRGGVPVLTGTRFTIAQVFAELAEGRSLTALAEDFDLDGELLKKLLEGLALYLDQPVVP